MIRRSIVERWPLVSLLLAAALVAGAAFVATGGRVGQTARAATPSAPQPGPPDNQAFKDGCTRTPADLIAGTAPEWAYIYNTPKDQAAPPPQWVTGTVSSGSSAFQAAHPAGDDLPSGHDAYDFNVNILPDPAYAFLVGGHPATSTSPATGNYAGDGEDTGRLHAEWEDTAIAKFAWPEPGDRITQLGSWVWDCGHWGTPTEIFSPDYLLPKVGQPCLGSLQSLGPILDPAQCIISGEGTEFHPYRALWDVRAQSNSPFGESEGELFVSTQATRAGIIANCAHKNPPSVPGTSSPAFNSCLHTDPNWQDVSGDYSFFLPAPPQPLAGTNLTFRAVNHGSVGAPAPTLTAAVQGGKQGVQVTFHLHTDPPSGPLGLPNGQQLTMGYTIYAGWSQIPLASVPTHLHITFNHLDVHRAMDAVDCAQQTPGAPPDPLSQCAKESRRSNQLTAPPGEWNIFIDVQGVWQQWYDAEFDPNDGSSFAGNQSADIYVPPGTGWRLYAAGRECDLGNLALATGVTGMMADCPRDHEQADGNDVPGTLLDTFASAGAFAGQRTSDAQTHDVDLTSTCPGAQDLSPNPNPHGCYSLTYTVTQINDSGSRTSPPGAGCHEGDGDGDVQGKGASPAHFHFDADSCEDGDGETVTEQDPNTGTNFQSTEIQSVAFDDNQHSVTIAGVGLNNGSPVSFVMVAVDGGSLPLDLYSLTLSNGYSLSGVPLLGSLELR